MNAPLDTSLADAHRTSSSAGPTAWSYRDFLEAKKVFAPEGGFAVALHDINPLLKPHQKLIVQWACRGGQRAIFAAFGLGKSVVQLEVLRLVKAHLESAGAARPVLQVAPLGVRLELLGDAAFLMSGDRPDVSDAQRAELAAWLDGRPDRRIELRFVRNSFEIKRSDDGSGPGQPLPGHYLANYESVRDGKLDPKLFGAAALDEASCLRGFGGTKTFREFMRLFDGMAYKFVATATPSPNEFIELLAYAAFLEVMDVGQAKTRFFKRNSEKADTLTIHPHKSKEFWLWVASWGLFVERPSDLGCDDTGYDLPPMEVHWHELPSNHLTAGVEKSGQGRLLKNAAASLSDAAREKRDSLSVRVGRVMEIVRDGRSAGAEPGAGRPEQVVLWCTLNDEQRDLERGLDAAGLTYASLTGSQDVDVREELMQRWKQRERVAFVSKPQMYGAGVNLQQCSRMVFTGIAHKFQDLIQACHRIYRFGQKRPVDIHFVYTEAERPIRDSIEAKWRRHDEQRAIMTSIIRQYGLSAVAMASSLDRTMEVERVEVVSAPRSGFANRLGDPVPTATGREEVPDFVLVNNDCVDEVRLMADNSVDLIVTSIPFSTQYEYSPSYRDFGHTDDDRHFWAQMDFLIPQLLRVLAPGRVAMIHVKDRIVPGGMTGLGFQTVSPFSDDCVAAFRRHGWAFLSRITVTTDVVRENNQTYRLGWTEQCKDGSRMGNGLPEYCLVFRKPPSDNSNGYADKPVKKAKKSWDAHAGWENPDGYSRGRWQLDAHGYHRSSGNRLLSPEELRGLDAGVIYRLWRAFSLGAVYDFEHHAYVAEGLEAASALPSDFMLLPPHSPHPEVWSDVTRMLSMNTLQAAQGRELHLCPLQFDIIDRAIAQYSEPGEVVFDPFGGVMSVPFRALKAGRKGRAVELNPAYFRDGCAHVARMAEELATPDLFGVMEIENADA